VVRVPVISHTCCKLQVTSVMLGPPNVRVVVGSWAVLDRSPRVSFSNAG